MTGLRIGAAHEHARHTVRSVITRAGDGETRTVSSTMTLETYMVQLSIR